MNATLKELAEAALLLPPKERAYLAQYLIASLMEGGLEQEWEPEPEAKPRRPEPRPSRPKPVSSEDVYRRLRRIVGE